MKIVFATGIAGCGKPAYLSKFEEYCFKKGVNCKVISIGDLIFLSAKEIGLDIKEEKILNLPRTTLRTLISLAFEKCIQEYEDKKYDLVIISTHASYWWKNGPEHAFNISLLNKINPDIYVTFINDVVKIRDNIYSDPKWGKDIITLNEIIIWQQLEVYTTEILAMLQKKDFYIYHITYPFKTLFDVIFSKEKLKIYTSFPITFAKDLINKTNAFINFLSKYSIVFNPVLEEDVVAIKDKDILEKIKNWIVRKDYKLIDQSNLLIAYFPEIIHSPGVEKEISYAHSSNKEVWLIFPSKRLSPFSSYYSDKTFYSLQEFKRYFVKFIKQRFRTSP